MGTIYSAPNFWAYFQKLEGRPMFRMLRSQWDSLKVLSGKPVPIDVLKTPMARITTKAQLEAVVAERRSDYEAEITIYRRDPKDAKPINVDKYLVWERIPDHRDLFAMVNTVSTSLNANMRGFLDESVFMVKQPRDHDHWLLELPDKVVAVIEKRF